MSAILGCVNVEFSSRMIPFSLPVLSLMINNLASFFCDELIADVNNDQIVPLQTLC